MFKCRATEVENPLASEEQYCRKIGALPYAVQTRDCLVWKRHAEQKISRAVKPKSRTTIQNEVGKL